MVRRRKNASRRRLLRLATGEPVGGNTLVPTRPLVLFTALAKTTGDARWAKAADGCFAWLEAHPLTDWNWDGQFEDVQPRPPYANPTKHNAVEAMFEILRRFPGNPARLALCRRIIYNAMSVEIKLFLIFVIKNHILVFDKI